MIFDRRAGLLRAPRKNTLLKPIFDFLLCPNWRNMVDYFKLCFSQEKMVLVDFTWAQIKVNKLVFHIQVKKFTNIFFLRQN